MKYIFETTDPATAQRIMAAMNGTAAPAAAPSPPPPPPPAAAAPAAPPPPPPPPAPPAAAAPPAPPPPPPPPAAAAPAAPPAPAAPAAAAGGYTLAHVQAAVQAYTTVYKAKGAKDRLQQLGYTKLGDIPVEQYAYVIQAFQVPGQ